MALTTVSDTALLGVVSDMAQEGVDYPRKLLHENSREKFAKKY
jgi:hypothetical protein